MIARILQACGLQNAVNISHVTTFALMSPRNGVQKSLGRGGTRLTRVTQYFHVLPAEEREGRGPLAGTGRDIVGRLTSNNCFITFLMDTVTPTGKTLNCERLCCLTPM